ncbi:cubilin homolog [Drosophila novamexicana]|uniref:cubilin homolog n=1 Tax=Drosophila novamexicana TaxID=47314 RepID=UPI0011E59CE9|nr:cubilin homolog [Drosophila novamexicana]
MHIDKAYLVTSLYLCLLALCPHLPRIKAAGARVQPQLHGSEDGTLLFEAATDQNITFRLMGEAATLLLNDVDVVSLLQGRQRAAAAQSAATRREPLSLDALKEQFRSVQRDLLRLARWLSNMQNGTRRYGPTQRVLRRDLQRVQVIANTLTSLETNLAKDECLSTPCKNGGTCYDAYNAFYCVCAAGWQGSTCEDDVNECSDFAGTDLTVCKNDAQCINTPGSYRCLCRNGFSGEHCRLRQHACLTNQSAELCGSHGTCLPANNAGGYVCICDPGWTWADTNVSVANASPCTRDVDECAPDVNPCHKECINLPGSYRCGACPPGYTGDGRNCRDINECADGNNGGCSQRPLVSCINTEGSFRCGRCPPGWTGDGRICNEAKSNLCNDQLICDPRAQCEYISGTVVCSCGAGFYGHGYGADGCTEDSSRKPCDDHRCLNNGTCVLSGRGTSCICQPGYTGAVCAEADNCHPNPCHNGGTCRLLPGNQHQCMCPVGYTGSSCSHMRSYCGLVLRNETGTLQFPPGDNSGYQPNERCAFIIRSQRGMVLNVTFGMFELQPSADCSADFVQLHDGSSLTARLIGRFCGSGLPLGNGSVVSTQEQLFFWFRSDNETQARGFNLTWKSQPLVCGEDLTLALGESGILRSPSYPGKARPGLDCRWHLTAPYGTRWLLRFYEITLGNSIGNPPLNCSNGDSLSVRDADRQLYMACQSAQPAPLHSSSNLLHIHFHTDQYRTDSSFQLHYEVVTGHPGCGGIFTEPSGLISGHMNAELCLYLIEQPNGTRIELNFQRINLLRNEDCSLQKVEIFDGRSDELPLLGRYCGQPEESELQPLLSSSNVVLVRYAYALPGLELRKSFVLRYNRACTGIYSDADGGIITSPNYPNPYFENLNCTYYLRGPTNAVVHINITDLSLSETQPPALESDELSIQAEDQLNYLDVYLTRNESEKQRFVKNLTNLLLISTNNQARLVFHSASNPQRGRGLRVEYTFVENSYCGGVLSTPSGGVDFYLYRHSCQWIIEAPGRKHLRGHCMTLFGTFNLYIYDNSTGAEGKQLHSYHINEAHKQFEFDEYTDSNLLTIIATSSPHTAYGVTFQYEPIKQECGATNTARYGNIKSPNWPLKYGPSENCTWLIRAPLGSRIELIVKNFTLEASSDACYADYLEIRNGDQPTSPLIGRYCGDRIPPRLPSYGNVLYVHFESDYGVEEAGFHLIWEAAATGCGGKLSSSMGAIHSPHNVAGNSGAVACDWQISVAQGSTVRLQLQSRDDVCNGQLTIYDGPTTRSNQLRLNCSSAGQQMNLEASSNRVLVRYNVDNETPEDINFVLDYTTNCQVRLEQMRGAIETPNFPDNYPTNTNCEWDIRGGASSNRIQLVFSHLAVERTDSDNCIFDYVLLGDYRDEQLISERRLCSAKDLDITSVGNRLLIRFNSDASEQEQGFHAEYKRLGCGDELQGPGGTFETPNAPYSVGLDCDWSITVPEGYQIRLLLRELHIETPQGDCSQDVLTVMPGGNSSQVLLRSCQVESNVQTLISPANELRVRFQSSPQRARKYIKASYVMVPAVCGGYMSLSSGTITSPGFYEQGHDIYDKDVECVWTLEATDTHSFLLHFEPFNLTDSSNCSVAWLELSSTKAGNSERFIERYCGDKPPSAVIVQNRLRLHFKVSSGFWGKFALHYERICGGGRIASEGYLRSRLDEHCYWTIFGPEGSKISLNINQLDCPRCTAADGNCTAGLRILNNEDEVQYYNLCQEHPANLLLPTNKVRIQSKGIALEAQYTTIENSCGGNITSVRGTLSSPSYPDSYPANVECVWLLEPRAGNAIELNFEAVDIAKSEHCNADFLEVRAGILGAVLGLYCGKELPAEPLLVRTKLWLKFRSQPGSSANGFKLRWIYVHDNELTEGTNGTIESPSTVAVRGDDQPYSWRIFTERERVLALDFKEYNTGLLLFDGFDDSALPISIGSSPWQFTSSSNVIYLKTVNTDFDAFRIEWRALRSEELKSNVTLKSEECNKVYTLDNAVVNLNSPGYPHGYKPNLNCEWTFTLADPTKHAYVDLFEVRLEAMSECQADYLSVQSSSNLLDWPEQLRICNSSEYNGHSLRRVDGTPNLRLQFVTDATVNGTGFRSIVRTECGSNMTGSVGTILNSHTQKRMDFNDSTCEWHIEVRPGRVIDITIDYNGAALNASCPHYGIIHDGLDAAATILGAGKFCNQLGFASRSYRTSGPHAYITYHFPHLIALLNPEQNRWNLTYREFSECDAEVRLTQQASSYNISTPGYPYYPHAHSDCTWVVIAPPGETIAANFVDDFDLSLHNCDKEFVEMYDGSTTLARRLLHTCRRTGTTYSSGNLLLVHYQTQLNEPHGGFRLNVSISSCGGHFTSYSGAIKSEHYPSLGAYPKPAVCEYTIKVPTNRHIQLNFSDLHLPFDGLADEEPETASIDRIELLDLTDERRILMTLYGNVSTPYPVTLSTNAIALRLVTVKTVHNYRGFKLEYKAQDGSCNRVVNAASGGLEIRKLQTQTRLRLCQWRITVPKGQRVRLELLNLADLRASEEPDRMSRHRLNAWSGRKPFAFYNDPNFLSKIIEFNLNEYDGNGTIESTDNFMLAGILLKNQMSTLRARFSSSEASPCPPDIGSEAVGVLSDQELINLPSFYCEVRFVADPGETISFSVQEYRNVEQHLMGVRLNDDVLQTTISVSSGNATFSLATTAGKVVLLKRVGLDAMHFRATYRRYACGGQLQLAEGSLIELPQLSEHFGQLECVWTLRNANGYELRGNVSFSNSCDREHLIISRNIGGGELARICGGTTQLNTTLLEFSQAKVLYHATQYRAGNSQFQLQASRPKSLGGWSNIVRVGEQPTPPVAIDAHSYRNNMELSWEFQASYNMSLRLVFQGRFFIEMAPNCSNDQLEVLGYQLGIWQPLAKYCGRELPQPLHIQASRMRIVFRTNANITADGFTFVVFPSCDAKLVASTEVQTLPSIRGLLGRWRSQSCNFEISTDTKHQLLVSVKGKGRAWNEVACRYAYFDAYRQYGQQEQLIGKRCPDFEVSGYERLRLHFVSMASLGRFFELQYQLVGCGGNYTTPFTLRPPRGNTEGSYANDLSCEWHVLAPPQHAIFVRFKYFEIESTPLCRHDHVSIYRGNAVSEEQNVARLCGNLTELTYMVDSNQATILAKLEGYIDPHGRGFMASVHFTPNCNERLALGEGNTRMSLVRHYQLNGTNGDDLHCYFRASVPLGYRLSVWLKQLQLNTNRCVTCNSLEVIDGFGEGSASMGTYYAVVGNGSKLFSSREDLLIKLSGSEAQPNGISFELILEMETTVCGQTDVERNSNESVHIFLDSNNVTSGYEGSIHCVFHFNAEDEMEIDIHSVQLQDVSQSTGKCIDYLLLSVKDETNKYYCGKFNNTILEMPKDVKFDLTFHSTGQEAPYMFDITLKKKTNCNRTYNALNRMIQYYTNNENELDDCINYIRVPEEYYLTFEIMFLNFEYYSSRTFFNMTDLRTNRSIYNATEGRYISYVTKYSTTNAVRLWGLGVRYLQLFYYASSSKLPVGCGGDLTSLEGQISNPFYENRNYSECSWRISVPAGKTLQFSFRSFDMGSETNCPLDNIKIYEVLPDYSEKLRHTFCGRTEPEAFSVNYNRLRIIAKKSPNFDGIGFQLYYNYMYE